MKTIYEKKRVARDLSRAVISGVCAGVAKHFDIDPIWVRGGAAAGLVFAPMITLPAYVAAVILLPRGA
ncbi:MAG: PspC domain-containing protein [Alteromonadaceae bacterium]|nr:PspC domain-containing protein [Alteromonadaceae bacterium]